MLQADVLSLHGLIFRKEGQISADLQVSSVSPGLLFTMSGGSLQITGLILPPLLPLGHGGHFPCFAAAPGRLYNLTSRDWLST